jgi:hypothetical protein
MTSNEWNKNFQCSSPTPQYLHLPSNIYKIKQLQYAREREKKKNKIGTQESSKCVFCVNLYCKQTFTRYLKCAKEEPKIWLVFIRMWCYWGVNAQSWNMKTRKMLLMPLPFQSKSSAFLFICLPAAKVGNCFQLPRWCYFKVTAHWQLRRKNYTQYSKNYWVSANYIYFLNIIQRHNKRHKRTIILITKTQYLKLFNSLHDICVIN